MKYDSNYYTPENFVPKFKKLLDSHYSYLPEHKRRGAFESDYLDEYQADVSKNNIESSVKKWFSYKGKPSIEKLMNICDLLDCDIDYFLTEQEGFKKEICNASEITGLNYNAIETLDAIQTFVPDYHTQDGLCESKNIAQARREFHLDKGIIFLINNLLVDTDGTELLSNMFQYLFRDYYYCGVDDGFSTTINLKTGFNRPDDKLVASRELAENFFYNKVMSNLIKYKDKVKSNNASLEECLELPCALDIMHRIQELKYFSYDDHADRKIKDLQIQLEKYYNIRYEL